MATIIRITEDDFMRANRRAARREEFEEHGRSCWARPMKHASMKAYNRARDRRQSLQNIDY